MQKHLAFLFAIAFTSTFGVPALAIGSTGTLCKIYRANDAPADVREILSANLGEAVEVCSLSGGGKSYSVASAIAMGKLGSCQYSLRSVFPVESDLGRDSWSFEPSAKEKYRRFSFTFLNEPLTRCPVQGSADYVQSSGLSEGTFLTLMRAWREMSRSEHAFSSATARLSKTQLNSTAFQILRSCFSGRFALEGPARITVVTSERDFEGTATPRISISAYCGRDSLELSVDITPIGLRIFDLGIPTP
jgi:hypothetical protein